MNPDSGRPRPDAANGFEIDRRRFLAMAGAGAALGAAPLFARTTLPVDYPLSIGYLDGSDRLASLAVLPWRASSEPSLLVPAAEIPSGDPALALETLSVRIAGLYPDWPWPGKLKPNALDLDVLFEPFDPYAPSPLPFAAWSFRRRPARNMSSPVRFDFPMEASDGLGLRLQSESRQGRRYDFAGAFTVDTTPGFARLQRGIYFLAIEPGSFDREVEIPGFRDEPDYSSRALVLTIEAPRRLPPTAVDSSSQPGR